MSRSRTVRSSVGAATAALALLMTSACSVHPGVAALVGSQKLQAGHVDDVAKAICASSQASGSNPTQPLASRSARQGALDVLISGALSKQYGASLGLKPAQSQVSSALASNEATVAALPKADQSVFRDTLKTYVEGQLVLVEVGTVALQRAGTKSPTQQDEITAGTKLRDAWAAKHVKVKVDPRYGTYSGGALRVSSGSLSVPVSASAVKGAAATPSATWTAALPANEKCG